MDNNEARSLIGKDLHTHIRENSLDIDKFLEDIWEEGIYFCIYCGLIRDNKNLDWSLEDGEKDPICNLCKVKHGK